MLQRGARRFLWRGVTRASAAGPLAADYMAIRAARSAKMAADDATRALNIAQGRARGGVDLAFGMAVASWVMAAATWAAVGVSVYFGSKSYEEAARMNEANIDRLMSISGTDASQAKQHLDAAARAIRICIEKERTARLHYMAGDTEQSQQCARAACIALETFETELRQARAFPGGEILVQSLPSSNEVKFYEDEEKRTFLRGHLYYHLASTTLHLLDARVAPPTDKLPVDVAREALEYAEKASWCLPPDSKHISVSRTAVKHADAFYCQWALRKAETDGTLRFYDTALSTMQAIATNNNSVTWLERFFLARVYNNHAMALWASTHWDDKAADLMQKAAGTADATVTEKDLDCTNSEGSYSAIYPQDTYVLDASHLREAGDRSAGAKGDHVNIAVRKRLTARANSLFFAATRAANDADVTKYIRALVAKPKDEDTTFRRDFYRSAWGQECQRFTDSFQPAPKHTDYVLLHPAYVKQDIKWLRERGGAARILVCLHLGLDSYIKGMSNVEYATSSRRAVRLRDACLESAATKCLRYPNDFAALAGRIAGAEVPTDNWTRWPRASRFDQVAREGATPCAKPQQPLSDADLDRIETFVEILVGINTSPHDRAT